MPACRPRAGAGTCSFTLVIWKWGLLLPGAPEPRLTLLRRQDFRSVFQTALRGLSNRSIVVVCNYEIGPITAEPCRAKARPLRPRRSYFAPVWWRRRVLPPGPKGLLRRPFIAISGLRRHPQYKRRRLTKKEQSFGVPGEATTLGTLTEGTTTESDVVKEAPCTNTSA
jgi:hypothetical protein